MYHRNAMGFYGPFKQGDYSYGPLASAKTGPDAEVVVGLYKAAGNACYASQAQAGTACVLDEAAIQGVHKAGSAAGRNMGLALGAVGGLVLGYGLAALMKRRR